MRILADENIFGGSISRLRDHGYDVMSVKETYPSEADINLLELATSEERILITHDTDFGELVHRDRISAPYGVLLFRLYEHLPGAVKAEFVANSVIAWNSWPQSETRLRSGIWTIQIRHQRIDAIREE